MNILIGLTGTVASSLAGKLYSKLCDKHKVKFILTENSKQFTNGVFYGYICGDKIGDYNYRDYFYDDKYEFYQYSSKEKVLHVELRNWADVFLIISSANTMAKIANGICDNLLTSVARAWDFKKKFYIAPACNTNMWLHPVTKNHISVLELYGINVIYPTCKKLACGDVGVGALADLDTIVNIVEGHKWLNPLNPFDPRIFEFIPLYPHPGSFGVNRKVHCHSGVDLYADIGASVFAVEDGIVVSVGQFTGDAVGCGYWKDTWYCSIRGKSGTVVYGEIRVSEDIVVGKEIKAGEFLGNVLEVLRNPPKVKPEYHKTSMLHIELLSPEVKECPDWKIGDQKPKEILDPTPYLRNAVRKF